MRRVILTYATGAHEELLDVAMPTYRAFANRHGYDLILGEKLTDRPPSWNKVPLLLAALEEYDVAVWFDCDLIVVDPSEDLPQLVPFSAARGSHASHALVRHFEDESEVPNGGVWQVARSAVPLLRAAMDLEVFTDHGWWEQAALMTLMGYTVPPQGSDFRETKCRCVHPTRWYRECYFMRLAWNSHPQYRAEHPRIVHCSYADMTQRIEVMRALVRDPHYNYPKCGKMVEEE